MYVKTIKERIKYLLERFIELNEINRRIGNKDEKIFINEEDVVIEIFYDEVERSATILYESYCNNKEFLIDMSYVCNDNKCAVYIREFGVIHIKPEEQEEVLETINLLIDEIEDRLKKAKIYDI